MEHIRRDHSPAASYLLDHIAHLTVVDVGCSGGLDPAWAVCGDKLRAIGFDPIEAEIAVLTAAETRPGVRYRWGYVMGDGGPHLRRDPSDRLSFRRTLESREGRLYKLPDASGAQAVCRKLRPRPEVVRLPDCLHSEGLTDVDFIKIDVDGGDFEILKTLPEVFAKAGVLGAALEVNYFGGPEPDHHTFHNTDRLMRKCGFDLFNLSVRRYSSAALPLCYTYAFPAQTVRGRPLQGDALYLRDLGWKLTVDLAPEKVIKLAALFAIFDLQDQAAETLVRSRERLTSLIDVDLALDQLVQELGFDGGYTAYMARFDADDPMFYPASRRSPSEN
jgi:Methyltransferase FkbM domain